MRFRMRAQVGGMRCPLCKQMIGGPIRGGATNTEANLFGAARHAYCINCNQYVPDELRTPDYKSAWDVRAQEFSDRKGNRRRTKNRGNQMP